MIEPLQIFIAVVPAIATAAIGYIFHKLKKRDERRDAIDAERDRNILAREQAINQSLRALCRDRILQGFRYYRHHGYISTADLETMTKLYDAYHALGGNGTITAVYDKICALPIKAGE